MDLKEANIHAVNREVFKKWMIDQVGLKRFKEFNFSNIPLLEIKCECGREESYNQWKNVPRKSRKCKCGNYLIKYKE